VTSPALAIHCPQGAPVKDKTASVWAWDARGGVKPRKIVFFSRKYPEIWRLTPLDKSKSRWGRNRRVLISFKKADQTDAANGLSRDGSGAETAEDVSAGVRG